MKAEDVKKVAVIGAGVMGHSIAQAFAAAGLAVNLVDVNFEKLKHALSLSKAELKTLAEYGQFSHEDIPKILDRIYPTTDLAAATADVEFAIETVSEIASVKKTVFSQLDEFTPKETVLASNTSSLDIFKIVQIQRPERLVAAHWFVPPNIIPLVEVAPGPETLPEAVAFTAALMKRLGKKTLVMKRFAPALIVNRIQHFIRLAAIELIENDLATPAEIDFAVKASIGIRLPNVGVYQTYDFAGLDLIADINKNRGIKFPLIDEKVKKGHLGAKTSKGIYDYSGRSEDEILEKRDRRYLETIALLERINAFEPV